MTTTYTFDVFCSLDGYGAAGADWTGYWGKQGPNCSTGASPSTAGRSAWSSAPTRTARSPGCWRRAASSRRSSTLGHADATPPGHRRVDDAGGSPRLTGRDGRGR